MLSICWSVLSVRPICTPPEDCIHLVPPLKQSQLSSTLLNRVSANQVEMTTEKSECWALCLLNKRMTRMYQSFGQNGYLQGTPISYSYMSEIQTCHASSAHSTLKSPTWRTSWPSWPPLSFSSASCAVRAGSRNANFLIGLPLSITTGTLGVLKSKKTTFIFYMYVKCDSLLLHSLVVPHLNEAEEG